MAFTPTYLPFVRGIQDADADSADTQNGKLADAVNVHVHPERANVLSLRPPFVLQAQIDENSRVFAAGGSVAATGSGNIYIRNGVGGTLNTLATPARFYAVESIRKLTVRGNDNIFAQCYSEQTNGDSLVLVSQGNTTTGYRTYYQLTINGQRKPEVELGTSSPGVPGRVWAFPRTGGGWVVFFASGGSIAIAKSTANDGAIVAPGATVGTSASTLDIIKASDGKFAVLTSTVTPTIDTYVFRCDENGASSGSTKIVAKISALYGGLIEVATDVFHVWVGGFPVDANDTVYCYRYTLPSTVALLGSQANALNVVTTSRISVGGGFNIKLTSSTTGGGSYCYLAGGNGSYARIGRLFLCDNSTITQSTYTAPILPMGRIWCDSSFFGARLWGTQKDIAGCWELTPTTTVNNDVLRCIPLAYITVTGSNLALDLGDPIRHFSIVHGTDYSVCAIPGREYAINVVRIGYNDATRGSTVNNAGFDVMLGAVPRYWDGVGLAPVGIPQAPLVDSVSVSPSTGSVPAGTYLYTIVWEWFDAQGRRQQSAADIATAIVASASSVILEIHPATIPYDERIIGTRPALRGVVYRSDAGGTILKRGALYLEFTTVGPTSGLYGATQFLVTDDGTVDFSLGEPLYMSAGGANELAATAMEESFLMRPYADRFIGVSRAFPDQLWYTKTLQVARGIEPNQDLYFRLPETATGLAVQDGNIYWFSTLNCYAFLPQFADDTGAGGGGVDAVPIATGVGCTSSNSIVETPVGVFFIGPRGPWVIARGGGAPSYVGAEVEQFFREFPVCRGACYNASFSEVVFAMDTASATSHCLIIYNHVTQQWYRWMIGNDKLQLSGAIVKSVAQGVVYAGSTLALGASVDTNAFAMLGLVDSGQSYDQTIVGQRAIHPYVETKNFTPSNGPGELIRFNRIALDCATSNILDWRLTLESSADDGATWTSPYQYQCNSSSSLPIYRFPVQKTRGTRVRVYNTWNNQTLAANQINAPTVLNGATVYTSPLGRAKSGAAQYRG